MLWRLIKNNSNPPLCAAEERLGKIFTAKKILPRIIAINGEAERYGRKATPRTKCAEGGMKIRQANILQHTKLLRVTINFLY